MVARKGSAIAESLVFYECTAAEHRVGGGSPDKLTIHQGQWAFCPFDSRAEGHEWVRTEGFALEVMLMRHRDALRVEAELADKGAEPPRGGSAARPAPSGRQGPSGSTRKAPEAT